MELHTLENLHEDFETGVWKVRKFVLPNASEYLWDIDNIRWAETGLINAFGSNRFFDEASQMIANSIYLFQEGFFDAAFYSLRQSIEISIGTLYLTANPEKMNEWKKLEPGFESGKMANFLREHEPVFKEIRTKMSTFFDNIHAIQKKTNKYVHKQGFFSFYTTQRLSWSDHREEKIYNKIVADFEKTLKVAIGAVAVYRLAIDPLPIILMDAELMTRSGDFMTEPYSKEFVDKYIGLENIELYKQTEIYQDYKEWLMSQEKQNEAVYNIIHWQIIEKTAFLNAHGVETTPVYWPDEKPGAENNVMKMIADHKFDLIVNIPKNHSKRELTNGYRIRRGAIDHNIPLITNARLASAFIEAFCELKLSDIQIKSWQEYK